VLKTHSRPQVSNDNPFSESQFKTMKYRPGFPDRFGSIEHGRAFGHVFFLVQRRAPLQRPGISPRRVHYGWLMVREKRSGLPPPSPLTERFVRGHPSPRSPQAVWINPPESKRRTTMPQDQRKRPWTT
jgi:putative transposase